MKRRELLKNSLVASTALFSLSSLARAADQCAPLKTPRQVQGPFYPVIDQLDKDADLVQIDGATKIAEGDVVIIQGQVLDQHCVPVVGALVEIWQACKSGRYNHPSDPNTAWLDPNFQYWGKAVTDQNGNYRFRTIIPGSYPAGDGWVRPPHIHYKVAKLGYRELITQMYFAGQELNHADLILGQLRKADQNKVIVELKTIESLPHPVGQFDIVIDKISRT